MKKFLISLSAGLFVISMLVAPVATFAAPPVINPSDTCTIRSAVSPEELSSLTGVSSSSLSAVPAGAVLPDEGVDAATRENFAIICAYSFIAWATNIAFLLIAALSVLVIAYAAFLYITAAGNPEKAKVAKGYILYAVIGIAVAVLARIIPNIVINFLG